MSKHDLVEVQPTGALHGWLMTVALYAGVVAALISSYMCFSPGKAEITWMGALALLVSLGACFHAAARHHKLGRTQLAICVVSIVTATLALSPLPEALAFLGSRAALQKLATSSTIGAAGCFNIISRSDDADSGVYLVTRENYIGSFLIQHGDLPSNPRAQGLYLVELQPIPFSCQ